MFARMTPTAKKLLERVGSWLEESHEVDHRMISQRFCWIYYPAAIALSSVVLASAAGACSSSTFTAATAQYKLNNIWSGVVIQDVLNRFANPENNLNGYWTVPNFTAATYPKGLCDGKDHKVAQWIGWDGTGGLQILQAGIFENVTCTLDENSQIANFQATYQPFWQWGGSPHYFSLPFALPGTMIGLGMQYCLPSPANNYECLEGSAPPSQSPTVTLDWGDNNDGTNYVLYINPDGGNPLVGNTAEWIVEDPPAVVGGNGVQNLMADYGKTDFSDTAVGVTDASWNCTVSCGYNKVGLYAGGYGNPDDSSCWPSGFSPLQFTYYNISLAPGRPSYLPGQVISAANPGQATYVSNGGGYFIDPLDFAYCGPGIPGPIPGPTAGKVCHP